MTAPPVVIQKLKLFRKGKATSRAPICSGIDIVHEARDERHRHEENHDGAVGGENLVVMMCREVSFRWAEGESLLQDHHDGIGESAQQHDDRKDDVHDADLLVIDAREPFPPEVAPLTVVSHRAEERAAAEHDSGEGRPDDRVMGDRAEVQPSKDELLEIEIREHAVALSLEVW